MNIMVAGRAPPPMPVAARKLVGNGASFDMKRCVSVAPKMAGTMLIRQQGKLLMSAGGGRNTTQMIDLQPLFAYVNISLARMGRTTGSKEGRALTGSRPNVSLKG